MKSGMHQQTLKPSKVQFVMLFSLLKRVVIALGVVFAPTALSDDTKPSPQSIGILSSFDIPLNDLKEAPDGNFFERLFDGFSGNFNIGVPLDLSRNELSSGEGFRSRVGNTLSFKGTVKYNPVGAWFVAGTAYLYEDPELQQDWNPDFSYVFGYDDWRSYTFSLIYSNYGGNRFNPDREDGEEVTEFNEGTISLGWKFPLTHKIAKPFLLSDDGGIGCIIGYNVSPQYFDLQTLQNRPWKQAASLGCKYTIKGNWYLNWTLFYYPKGYQQQPWDPDFTYGFGYFDWRPGTLSIQYNNFSGNRFPGRSRGENTGRFIDGEFSVSWSWSF